MLLFFSRIPKTAQILLLFLSVFLWFFCTKWYGPAQLIISGSTTEKDGLIEVNWDSGGGYNSYESRRFFLNTISETNGKAHSIIIRNVFEKNSASLSTEVICERIVADGKDFDLSGATDHGGELIDRRMLRLAHRGDEINLAVEADDLVAIRLRTNNHSGMAEMIIDGKSQIVDLYIANEEAKFFDFPYWIVGQEGKYRVSMAMPRYPIKSLTIANGNVKDQLFVDHIEIAGVDRKVVLFSGAKETLASKTFKNVSIVQQEYFHRIQFFFQIIFSALTTWVLTGCWRVYRRCTKTGGLFCQERRFFWVLLVSAMAAFSFWLLAFWPGVMSVDSLKIWRAALLPEVLINDHPLLNVIYYRYLSGLWNNPAIVPISHIVAMSTLIAFILYSIYRRGVQPKYLLPFYFLTITSVPIGLYNILLWKDIPFALLIVFWAFLLCQFYQKKKENQFFLTKEQVFALFLSLLALAFTRHNGLIYLAVIPIYLVLLRLIPMRIVFIALLVGAGIIGGILLFFNNDNLITQGNYLFSQGSNFFSNFLHKPPSTIAVKAWQNYWGIFNINQKDSAWDLFHYFLYDRFSYSFILHAGWSDIYRYLIEEPLLPVLTDFAMRFYRQSCALPFVYLSWNSLYFLVLYPLSIVFFRILPLTAIFSSFILVQVLTLLVVIDLMNWRYYYFAFLGGYMLIPLIILDLHKRSEKKAQGAELFQ